MIIAPRNWFGQPMHRYAPPKAIATLGQRNPRRFSHPLPVHTVRFILQRADLRVHSSWPWRDCDAERPDSEPFWQDANGIGVAKGAAAVADRLWLVRHDRRLAALADQSNDPAKPACPPGDHFTALALRNPVRGSNSRSMDYRGLAPALRTRCGKR